MSYAAGAKGRQRSQSLRKLAWPRILVSILLSACVWLLLGFSLCFGATLGPTDDPGSLLGFQNWQEKDWHQALYYAVFALVAPQLAKGTVVPQLPMLRCCFFTLTWVTAVFVPLCHTVWGGGWLAQWGVEDFAGGRGYQTLQWADILQIWALEVNIL